MKKFGEIRNMVEGYLVMYPDTRDCDYLLYVKVMDFYDVLDKNAVELMMGMKYKRIPSFESVSRCRRQLQQAKEHLRGDLWLQRQGKLQEERKAELGYNDIVILKR